MNLQTPDSKKCNPPEMEGWIFLLLVMTHMERYSKRPTGIRFYNSIDTYKLD